MRLHHCTRTYQLSQYVILLVFFKCSPNIRADGAQVEQNTNKLGNDACSDCSADKAAYEAIKALHGQLDDDHDGTVDIDESVEFLKEELKYEKGFERRQEAFHKNNDKRVSVDELWDTWSKSEVQNWTIENTVEWLVTVVELPQYSEVFMRKQINGSFLPRLTNNQFLSANLGIKDPINKQKLSLKAMDVVLFGPPKDYRNTWKDKILVSLLLIAMSGCWFAYRQNKRSQCHLQKMMNDMESLHKAECDLMDLQKKLEQAQEEQKTAISEKLNLEQRLMEEREKISDSTPGSAEEEVRRLRAQVSVLREELDRAEGELQSKCWIAPPALKHWLQLTYEIESKSYNTKKISAETQLASARDACDKLKKKRSNLLGAFVSSHGKSIDDVEQAILQAKHSLNEVTSDLQERTQRWRQIESLCACSIINNPGKPLLDFLLRGNDVVHGSSLGLISGSQDDLDDDMSIYSPSAVQKLVSSSAMMFAPSVGCNISNYIPSVSVTRSQRRYLQTRDSGSSFTSDLTGSIRSSYTTSNLNKPADPILPASKSYNNVGTLVSSYPNDCNFIIGDTVIKSDMLKDLEVHNYSDATDSVPLENVKEGNHKKIFYTGDGKACEEPSVSPIPPKRKHTGTKLANLDDSSSSIMNGHRQLTQGNDHNSLKLIKLQSVNSKDNLLNNLRNSNPVMDEEGFSTDSSINIEDESRKGKAKKLFASFARKKKTKN